jgi:signal transduction histidine kinase
MTVGGLVSATRSVDASSSAALAAETRQVLATFVDHTLPARTLDLSARFGDEGRAALLDPWEALPTWHRHPYEAAALLARYARSCRAEDMPPDDAAASLHKALLWQRVACGQSPEPDESFFDTPPFMHPSGRSYARLAATRPGHAADSHARALHVTELTTLGVVDPELDPLPRLPRAALRAIVRGDEAILDDHWLLARDVGASPGGDRLRVFPRESWDAYLRGQGFTLVPRGGPAICSAPATPALCWAKVVSPFPSRAYGVALGLLVLASVALVVDRVRAGRLARLDRALVLRTLTHELRTPATALALSLEPLRSAYDTLPTPLQEPLLRASSDVERIKRVLAVSASWLALHDGDGGRRDAHGFDLARLPHAFPFVARLVEGYGGEVEMVEAGTDGPLTTDPRWLGVAIKNLIDNALAHGRPPVRVHVARERTSLAIEVVDAGDTRGVRLGTLTAAFRKGEGSTGLGLGLAIVAQVARALGGRLEHRADPTTFRLVVADLGRWTGWRGA